MMRVLKLRLLRTPLAFGLGLGLALAAPFVGVGLIKSLMVRLDEQAAVHPDRSVFESGVSRRTDAPVRFLIPERGEVRAVDLDPGQASALAASLEARMARQRPALHAEIDRTVAAVLAPLRQAADARVEGYAEWYFGWPTSYRLAGVAALSAIDHALEARVTSLADAVGYDVAAHVRRHYEERVLEPEITEPKLQHAFRNALERTRVAHVAATEELAAGVRDELLAEAKRSTLRRQDATPRVTVDWGSQLHKLSASSHERGGLDGALRGALVGTSGLIGARGALASGTGRLAAAGVPAVRGPALAAPAARRGVARIGLSAAGATLAGPVGFAVGLGTGLVLDLAINEADEALHRDAFEASVRRSVAATFDDLEHGMKDELRRTADVWLDQTHAALQLRLR